MSISRQQKRYLEKQELKRKRSSKAQSVPPVGQQPTWPFTKILAALAAVSTIASSAYLFWPTLDVLPQVLADPKNPISTKFDFKNTGRIRIQNVEFDCLINTIGAKDIRTSRNSSIAPVVGRKSQVIGDLEAGSWVSRDCFGGAGDKMQMGGYPASVEITARFVWPLIRKSSSVSRYFVSETDTAGRTWMTPERKP